MASNRQQALPSGTVIDGFEVRRVLGTGGFGVTYLAYDTSLERPVAIKEYCPQGIAVRTPGDTTLAPGDPELEGAFSYGLSRFLDEARTLARFHHPSIVRVQRFLEANGTGYLIMDLEQGDTLWHTLRRRPPLEDAAVMALLVPILEGLEMVHGESILHRDIKPANILLRHKGGPVLLDFGAARLAMERQAGNMTILLTPGYAPLEQYSPTDQQGPWSDIYALGATAYHCMTGQAPMAATERIARVHSGEADPVPQQLAQAGGAYSNLLCETVLWMLETVASKRPQSTAELLQGLRPTRASTTTVAVPAGAATRASDFEPTPELTQSLQSTLEAHAGRVARRVVAPAVARAASYEELIEHLAGFVIDPERQEAFRSEATQVRARSEAAGSDAATPAVPTPSLSAELLAGAAAHLAHFVGPIAELLVEQAAATATTREQLHELLAQELDDAHERREFLSRVK
jgi:serine/threonine protein kinase